MNRGAEPEEIVRCVLFPASNKDENGVDLFPDQRPLKDWIASHNK